MYELPVYPRVMQQKRDTNRLMYLQWRKFLNITAPSKSRKILKVTNSRAEKKKTVPQKYLTARKMCLYLNMIMIDLLPTVINYNNGIIILIKIQQSQSLLYRLDTFDTSKFRASPIKKGIFLFFFSKPTFIL